MSTEVPASADVHVRRRARTHRHGLFSRSLFRYPGRRRHSTFATVPTSEQDRSSLPEDASLSSFLHRHRHHNHHSARENQPKPIYIYPGLLRIFRDKAIALDNQCPAVLYKCRDCRRDQKLPSTVLHDPALAVIGEDRDVSRSSDDTTALTTPVTKCPHQTSCAICLEEFHGKDLVRKLPCNVNHVFHSKCILDWFISQHRCPLCNESVTNTAPQARVAANQSESRRHPGPFHRGNPDAEPPGQELQTDVHQQQPAPRSRQNSAAQPAARDQSRGQSSVQHRRHEAQDARQKPITGDKGKKKQRGPRTYSYIVHDSVRMEMNPVIPV